MMKQIIKKRTGKEEKKEKRYSRAKNMEKQSFELKRKREPSNDIDGPNRLVDSRTEIEAEIVEWRRAISGYVCFSRACDHS